MSAPARGVTWFMTVCAGARLTATAVVVYCLLCKGRFWQFAAHFCAPGVLVEFSCLIGWAGRDAGRGRWRLVA